MPTKSCRNWACADNRPKTLSVAPANSAKRIAMPFRAGPRVRPGRYLALLEMKMATAMLLGSFDIESVDTPDCGEVREHSSFTMTPVGLPCASTRFIGGKTIQQSCTAGAA